MYPVFDGPALGMTALEGAGDVVLVPDPGTFHVLPWAPRTASVLCDLHLPDGAPVVFSSRRVLRDQLDALALRGYQLVIGLEVEFHVLTPYGERLDEGGQLLLQDDLDPPTSPSRSCATGSSPSTCRCARSSTRWSRASSR